jgi:N-carbamoyl-L-amino-acid hydrolase
MNAPISGDGRFSLEPTVSKANDSVEFKAVVDSVVVMSACPQDLSPVNGLKPMGVHFVVGP